MDRNRMPYDSNASSDEIKSSIDNTRKEMDSTLDALGEKLNPRSLLDDLIGLWNSSRTTNGHSINTREITQTVSQAGKSLAHHVMDNPGPALIIGAGILWWIYNEGREERPRSTKGKPYPYGNSIVDARTGEPYYDPLYENNVQASYMPPQEGHIITPHSGSSTIQKGWETGKTMTEKVSDAKDYVQNNASGAASQASRMASQAKDNASHALKDAKTVASEKLNQAQHYAGEALDSTRHAMSQTWHSTASTAGQLAQDAQHRASRMSQYTYDSMSYYGNQMAGLGHRVLDDVRFYGNQARWKTMSGYKNGRRAFWNAVDDSPLLMGAGLLALGLCAGLLLPRTRSEDEWIGEYSDDMKHQVMHSGQDLMNRSMDAAGASIDTAVHEAEAQGLTPQQLLEKGKHIVTKAAQSIPSAVMDAAKEEGVDPHSIKEKVGTVAQKTTETAKDKSKVEKEEPRNEMKKDLHK